MYIFYLVFVVFEGCNFFFMVLLKFNGVVGRSGGKVLIIGILV